MSRFVLSNRAIQDLEAIGSYIAHDSVEAAGRVLDYIEEQLNLLATRPLIGRVRPDLWQGMLCFVIGRPRWRSRYLIFYRCTGTGIEVARIIEAHRNIAAALEDMPSD